MASSSLTLMIFTINNRKPGPFQPSTVLILEHRVFHIQEYPVVIEDLLASKPLDSQRVKGEMANSFFLEMYCLLSSLKSFRDFWLYLLGYSFALQLAVVADL